MTTLDAPAVLSKPRQRWRHFLVPWRREEGQAAFEFVLVLPLFVLFTLLMVDLGVMMYEYVSISNAAREGARYAAVNCDGNCTVDEVRLRTANRSGGLVDPTDAAQLAAEIDVAWPLGTNRGDPVSVTVVHPYPFLFFPVTIDVVSCADMRIEQQDQTAPAGGSGC